MRTLSYVRTFRTLNVHYTKIITLQDITVVLKFNTSCADRLTSACDVIPVNFHHFIN